MISLVNICNRKWKLNSSDDTPKIEVLRVSNYAQSMNQCILLSVEITYKTFSVTYGAVW